MCYLFLADTLTYRDWMPVMNESGVEDGSFGYRTKDHQVLPFYTTLCPRTGQGNFVGFISLGSDQIA